jgi:general secretion pathway protein B
LVLLLAVLAWQFVGGRAPEPVLASAPPALAVTPPAVAPPPPVAAQPTPPPTAAPAPVTVDPPAAALPPARPAQRQPPRVVSKKALAPASAPAAEPEAPVMAYEQLPDNIRRELPQLVIGGAMYSKTPASRMLILNGQVFHEGDKVAGELVLEQIRLKSAVLAYKGYRYGINY